MKFRKEDLIGKHILVGICYRDAAGRVERTVQNHGTVVACEEGAVEYQPVGAGDTVHIPYIPNFFEPGEPGAVYTLQDSGEDVTDVDVVVAFEVRPPREGAT